MSYCRDRGLAAHSRPALSLVTVSAGDTANTIGKCSVLRGSPDRAPRRRGPDMTLFLPPGYESPAPLALAVDEGIFLEYLLANGRIPSKIN